MAATHRGQVGAVFADRADAVAAADALHAAGFAAAQLVDRAAGLEQAYEWDADAVLRRSVLRGIVIGMPVAAMLIAALVVLDVGGQARAVSEIIAGGLPGLVAGVFFGGLAGVLAGSWAADAEQRWGYTPLAPGAVLVVPSDAHAAARHVLREHHGRVVTMDSALSGD